MFLEHVVLLQSSKQAFLSTYTEKHALNLQEVQKHFSDPATASIMRTLKPIVLPSLPYLILHHKKRDIEREMNAALTKFVEMEDQIDANNELEEKLGE